MLKITLILNCYSVLSDAFEVKNLNPEKGGFSG